MKSSLPEAGRPSAQTLPPEVTAVGPSDTPAPSSIANGSIGRQDHIGQQLGDFRLVRRLGEGGMGQVYLAEQISLQRRVAVKLLRRDFAENATFLKRFEAEAKAIAQLTHSNIVQVYSVGNDQGLPYMALEYVEGTNLKDYLNKKGPPELPIALAIMRQIASALLKAAELGIMHRDIKPENILITRKVEVKVADFGLSRMVGDDVHLTQTGTTMGTPLYMSPEQIMGKSVDPRTDLYSLGATCYHLLTGQPPFMAESAMAVGVRHLTDPPRPISEIRPDLPADLCQLVHRMLAKKPDDRPQTAREVLREIRKIQESLTGATTQALSKTIPEDTGDDDPLDFGAMPTTALPTASTRLDRNKRRWLLPVVGGSVMVAIVGGAIFGMMLRHEGNAKSTTLTSGSTSERDKVLNAAILVNENRLKQNVEETRFHRDTSKTDEPFPVKKMVEGVQHRAELMRFYVLNLDKETMVRAKQFTEQEVKQDYAPEPYRCIGLIGQAVLLAYESKHKESYETLERAFALRGNAKLTLQTQMLRNKDVVELLLITFRMNEKQLSVPNSLTAIREELDKIEKGIVPEKLRPNKK